MLLFLGVICGGDYLIVMANNEITQTTPINVHERQLIYLVAENFSIFTSIKELVVQMGYSSKNKKEFEKSFKEIEKIIKKLSNLGMVKLNTLKNNTRFTHEILLTEVGMNYLNKFYEMITELNNGK